MSDSLEEFQRKQREKKEKEEKEKTATADNVVNIATKREPEQETTELSSWEAAEQSRAIEPSRTVLEKEAHFKRGEEALDRQAADLTWLDWMDIGVALDIARSDAMTEAETNKPKGSRYNKEFNRWLEKHPKYRAVDDGDRTRLYEVIAKRAEIEKWRHDYFLRKPNEKQRLNHPSTVLRKWKMDTETAEQKKARADKKALRQPSSLFSPALKKANAKIEQQAARIKEVEEERDSACDTVLDELYPEASPWELAQGIIRRVDAKKARDVANVILKELDKPTPPKGGKAKPSKKKGGKKSDTKPTAKKKAPLAWSKEDAHGFEAWLGTNKDEGVYFITPDGDGYKAEFCLGENCQPLGKFKTARPAKATCKQDWQTRPATITNEIAPA